MSYYMCPICTKVYDGRFVRLDFEYGRRCPDLDCQSCDAELFKIDEWMIEPIRLLNSKGYLTKYCCSGHMFHRPGLPYISFKSEWQPDSVPENWEMEECADGELIVIRPIMGDIREFLKLDDLDKQKFIFNSLNSLLAWCLDLPDNDFA